MMVQSASTSTSTGLPRSRRVAAVPSDFQLSSSSNIQLADPHTAPSSPPQLASPPLPPRSPLRPKAHTVSLDIRSSIVSIDNTSNNNNTESRSDLHHQETDNNMTLSHSRSFGTLSAMMDPSNSRLRPKTPEKPLPLPPPSPPPDELDDLDEVDEPDHDAETLNSSASSSLLPPTPSAVSKRTHALLELLSSERAYASDLALIRDIHIPLALGHPAPFQSAPATPPSSGSSSRTLSTASGDSSLGHTLPPPMSEKDTKIIFNNVGDLAQFSDMFTERLEEALGGVLEGGSGLDHVGALFLEMIPLLEPLYNTYITRHPTALEHLNSLPQTPSLEAYLAHTRTLAQSLTHAWDLPSLLIKPVQRLLKYSLLLGAIIDETQDAHPDKANLKTAREKMEAVAHGVNEGRRRREVVKEVLNGVPIKKTAEVKAKKKGLNMGVAASVSLGRMKSIRAASFKVKEGAEANQEAEQVARMGEELKACDTFIRTFAKSASAWSKSLTFMIESLRQWTLSFGQVIGVNEDQRSEAFDAFYLVVESRLLPICKQLEDVIEKELFAQLARLTDSMSDPERLLEAMRTLEPLHYGLLNFNVSKSRPPPQLLEASKSYVALRAQLFAELPKYLVLLHKGIVAAITQFSFWQVEYWAAVKEKWSELWDALKVEGEMQGSAADTLRVWWDRFAQIEASVAGLNIVRVPEKRERDREREKAREREIKGRARGRSFNGTETTSSMASAVVMSSLAALDPVHMIPASSASSQTLVASPSSMKSRHLDRKGSNESLHSKKSGKSTRSSHKHSNSNASFQQHLAIPMPDSYDYEPVRLAPPPTKPPYNRAATMPISGPMPLRKSSSHGRLLDPYSAEHLASSSSRSLAQAYPIDAREYREDDDTLRGRMSRKPSFKRRVTETLRPQNNTSTSRHRRSPSLPSSMNTLSITPEPSPSQASFTSSSSTAHRTVCSIPAMYECRVVHPCHPPYGITYRGIPFCTLNVGAIFDILQEAGHPSTHPDLPLVVDEGEDCLLLVRDDHGEIGWALASFLLPVA